MKEIDVGVFRKRLEFMFFKGYCLSCLRQDEWARRFLRSCFEEMGIVPETFNAASERIFPDKAKSNLIFSDGGANTRDCMEYQEFFDYFVKVVDEMKNNPIQNFNGEIKAEKIKNEIKLLGIEEDQFIIIKKILNKMDPWWFGEPRKAKENFWLIFSSVSESGIIRGYTICAHKYHENAAEEMRIVREKRGTRILFDIYDDNIEEIII